MRNVSSIVLLGAACATFLNAQNNATISGIVVDSATGQGIPEVKVYFSSERGAEYPTVTDVGGRFQIRAVKDGEYGSHYEKSGYLPLASGSMNSPVMPVRITGGKDSPEMRIELVPFAKLSGRVLDMDGEPQPKASVMLNGELSIADEQGRFVYTEIRPGSYTLYAEPASSHPIEKPGAERTDLVRTWYPAALDSEQSEVIIIRPGSDLTGYDIRLKSAPVYRISGVILRDDGRPETNAHL